MPQIPKPSSSEESDSKKLEDRLEEILYQKLGTDFRQSLEIKIKASSLAWVVKLAIWGLKAQTKKLQAVAPKERDVSDIMSIGSYMLDLDAMLEAIEKAEILVSPTPKTRNRNSK